MTLVVIAERLEQAQRAQAYHVGGVLGLVEGDAHVRLRGEVIDLVRPHLFDDRAAARCRRPGRRSAVAAAKNAGPKPLRIWSMRPVAKLEVRRTTPCTS